MIGRGLLTEGDCRALSAALQRQQQITLTRSDGAVRLTAQTLPAGPPWPVPMVVQVHVVGPMYSWRQNFGSILSLREAME